MVTDRTQIRDAQDDESAKSDAQRQTRTRLSEQMLDGRTGSDRLGQVAETDRSSFRADIAQRVRQMDSTLQSASDQMGAFNVAVRNGQLRPGTEQYVQAFQKAASGYADAIVQAGSQLLKKDEQGRIVPSELAQRVNQERQTVEQEKLALRQLAQSGQNLTPEQMQQLGVRSADVREAFKEKFQQGKMLEDFQRSLGYAQANFGLALIRATGNLPADQKSAQIGEGEKLLKAAAASDPQMLRDRGFAESYRAVYTKVGASPREPLGPIATPDGRLPSDSLPQGNPGDRVNLPPAGPGTPQDARFNFPTGNNRPDTPGFVDPFTLIGKADAMAKAGPLTREALQTYDQAIKTADAVDRDYLRAKMAQEQQFIKDRETNDPTGQLRSRIQAHKQLEASLPQMDANLSTLKSKVTGTMGQQYGAFIDTMLTAPNTAALQQFAQQENATVNALRQKPEGAQLLQSVQQRIAVRERLTNLDEEIKKVDPQYAKVVDDLNTHKRLYLSSLDARAHTIAALMPSVQDDPKNAQAARNLMSDIARMDKARVNDATFMATARALGMKPEELAGRVTTQTDNTAIPSIGIKADDQEAAYPPNKAAALFNQVMNHAKNGQPITEAEEKRFQELLTAQQQNMNPQALEEAAKKLRQASTGAELGNGQPVEQRLQQMAADKTPNGQAAFKAFVEKPVVQQYLQEKLRLDTVANGEPLIKGLYGMALLTSPDVQKKRLGAAMITEANTNQFAQGALPLKQIIESIGAGTTGGEVNVPGIIPKGDATSTNGERQRPDAPQADANGIPGWDNFARAVNILAQKDVSAVEKLKQARPDLDKALEASKQINPADEARRVAAAAGKPDAAAITEEAAVRASQPTMRRMVYATALNHAAVELYEQAQKDPSKKEALEKEAGTYNSQAIALLKQIGEVDPNYGALDDERKDRAQHAVQGLIQMAERREKMNANNAGGTVYAQEAEKAIQDGQSMYGVRALKPVAAIANAAGPLAPFVVMTEAPAIAHREEATVALAKAKVTDADAAQAVLDKAKAQSTDSWVHTAINLVSGPGAVYAVEKAAPMLAKYMPMNPLVKGGLSLLAAGGATYALDQAAHAKLGTTQLTNTELFTNTLASVGAGWAVRGAVGLRSNMAANALESGTTARAVSALPESVASKITLTPGASELTRAGELSRQLGQVSHSMNEVFDTARKAEYGLLSVNRQMGRVTVTPEMLKAAGAVEQTGAAAADAAATAASRLPAVGTQVSKAEWLAASTGVEQGSILSSMARVSNYSNGFMQRTLAVGADGKLIGTTSDMAVRRFAANVGPTALTGGVANTVFGLGEVNPYAKKADGTTYTAEEVARNMGGNFAVGTAAGAIAPVIPKVIGAAAQFPIQAGKGIGSLAERYTPSAYKWVAESKLAASAGDAGRVVSRTVNGAREFVVSPSTDLGTLATAGPSVKNAVSFYNRAYLPALSVPVASVVSDAYLAPRELETINAEAQRRADAYLKAREEDKRNREPAPPRQ